MQEELLNCRFEGLSPASDSDLKILKNTQGNILSFHGRKHTQLFFLILTETLPGAITDFKNYIKTLPYTSAFDQLQQTENFKKNGSEELFLSLYISKFGYQKMGKTFEEIPYDINFREGQKTRLKRLNETGTSNWEHPFTENIDFLILAAHDRVAKLEEFSAELKKGLDKYNIELSVQRGNSLSREENFGFVDGISQPLFLKKDIQKNFLKKPENWDSSFNPLYIVLARDPSDSNGYGSYLVYRKIEQLCEEFDNTVEEISKNLQIDKPKAECLIMGRNKNGYTNFSETELNDFNFLTDAAGAVCQLGSHIRKSNPRNDNSDSLYKIIARRGVKYNQGKKKGLHFMCFQQDIARQFEHIQKNWLNNPDFPSPNTGFDPIANSSTGEKFNISIYINGETHLIPLSCLTVNRGGEYFFAPSPNSIKNL